MSLTIPLPLRPLIQENYLNMRALWAHPDLPRSSIQMSFENLLYGVLGPDAWRSSHVSEGACVAMVEDWDGRAKLINRAHGVLPGSVDRSVRTAAILSGPEEELDVWWPKFVQGDTTVIVTRPEHNRRVPLSPLVPVPQGLFCNAGKSAVCSLFREGVWLSAQYVRITGRPSPIAGRRIRKK